MSWQFTLVEVTVIVLFVAIILRRRAKKLQGTTESQSLPPNEDGKSSAWSSRLKMAIFGAVLDEAYLFANALTNGSIPSYELGTARFHLMLMLHGALTALVLYEIIWRTRSHLTAANFPAYVLGVWYVQRPVSMALYWATLTLEASPTAAVLRPYYSNLAHWVVPAWSLPGTLFDFLAAGLTTGFAYYLIIGTFERSIAFGASFGGASMSVDETTRLLCASAWTSGHGFRKRILDHREDTHRAVAPELGVDTALVTQVCQRVEKSEKRYDWLFLLIGLVAALIAAAGSPTLAIVVGVAASAGLYLQKVHREHDTLRRFFQRGKFDPSAVREKLAAPLDPKLAGGFPLGDQNLVVYQGFTPFVGAGSNLGGWSFMVDTEKPPEQALDGGRAAQPIPFESDELYAAIDQAIGTLGLERLTVRDFWFANGAEIRDDRTILPGILARPAQKLDDATAAGYRKANDSRVRHYQWISVHDWGNELVMSYFLRCAMRGSSLFVEINRFLLTPLIPACHAIDRLPARSWKQQLATVAGSVVAGPVWVLRAALLKLGTLFTVMDRIFNTKERARREEIERDPLHNYGSSASLRQTFSSQHFSHYFQKMDGDFYTKVLEYEILDAIVTFLGDHNIDTSEIRERRALILNSGIIVQGGDVRAESLAVGAGAAAIKTQAAEGPKKPALRAKGAHA